jgi:hypothetical protein
MLVADLPTPITFVAIPFSFNANAIEPPIKPTPTTVTTMILKN